tara:strand:- start:39 stop:302 length:264 start_codon:yes stop_codon:yes gene_type:complete
VSDISEGTEAEKKEYLLKALISAYLDVYPVGGNLHIILEDGNVDADSINHCLGSSVVRGDHYGMLICSKLFEYSEEERKRIAWGENE